MILCLRGSVRVYARAEDATRSTHRIWIFGSAVGHLRTYLVN